MSDWKEIVDAVVQYEQEMGGIEVDLHDIAEHLGITTPELVKALCESLAAKGVIERRPGKDGKMNAWGLKERLQ